MIRRFKIRHKKILFALSKFKFLTYRQMVRLGIDNHISNLSKLVGELANDKRPLVQKIPHRIGSEVKVYLTKRGKNILVDFYELEESQIHFQKGTMYTDTQDQKHRTSIIDLHISLDQACKDNNVELLFCDRYFDFTGSNRINRDLKSKTAIIYEGQKTIKADMVFMLQTDKQKELYLAELERGKNTQKAIEKCIRHGQAILKASANENYDFHSGYRTLWIFEYESIMQACMTRIMKDVPMLHSMSEYFLFKSLDKTDTGFFQDWLNLTGENRKMYY